MDKTIIQVPSGIRYISEWNEFNFRNFPDQCIINKQLPGCGFTEWCIRNSNNVILCSPRKMLLQNKTDQHPGEVFLVRNELESELEVDKDLSKEPKGFIEQLHEITESQKSEVFTKIMSEFMMYYSKCVQSGLPIKILVTYDSYRIVKDILTGLGIFNQFFTVVDEFQTILHDSRFKSSTELEFMVALCQSGRVCFVSATPMIDRYLEMLDEFKDLPYFELDWGTLDSTRVIKPSLKILSMKSVGSKAEEIITEYKSGNFERAIRVDQQSGIPYEIMSREAVFYVNSVNHIISIIKRNNLTPEEVNILCSDTPDNRKRIQKRLGKKFDIGSVPLKGAPRKMFTFCTRTVYLGADFYSDNARSFIFSDSNYDCLAVDIGQDLPQILGRQRLFDNPWKNSAMFYYRTTCDYRKVAKEEFDKILERKRSKSESLLRAYTNAEERDRHALAENYQTVAMVKNYQNDYVAVNTHGGSTLQPVFNNLVLVSDIRAYEIQQIDYKDRFSVFCSITAHINPTDQIGKELTEFFQIYDELTTFYDKIRMLCTYNYSTPEMIDLVLNQLGEDSVKSAYIGLGPEKLRALNYNTSYIKKELGIVTFSKEELKAQIYFNFKVGDKISLSDIKDKLSLIYSSIGYKKSPKATDLLDYFDIKESKIYQDLEDGEKKRVKSYELLKLK